MARRGAPPTERSGSADHLISHMPGTLHGAFSFALLLVSPFSFAATPTPRFAVVPMADRFEPPVGQNGKPYYKSRSVQVNGHLGEDWNGVGGGNTDLGDPIHAIANGIVVFAQHYGRGWGGVVIIRHAYPDRGTVRFVDSLYGILLAHHVRVGEVVKRGQPIGRMGHDGGRYSAHLHFEMRKDLRVGLWRESFPRDESVYWKPSEFIAARSNAGESGSKARIPLDTFPASPPPVLAGPRYQTPANPVWRTGVGIRNRQLVLSQHSTTRPPGGTSTSSPRSPFRVDRYRDLPPMLLD